MNRRLWAQSVADRPRSSLDGGKCWCEYCTFYFGELMNLYVSGPMKESQHRRRPRWSMASGTRGFTLVELMIAVVLIAVLAGLSAPTIMSSMERNRLSQLNRDIANGFLEARAHAMRHGQAVFVHFHHGDNAIRFYEPRDGTTWDAPTCVRGQANRDDPEAGDANVVLDVDLDTYGVAMELEELDPEPPNDTICISPNGRVTNTNGLPLVAGKGDDCDELNFLIPVISSNAQHDLNELRDCVDDMEVTIKRELDNFSMIHVAYGGQVRVIR